MLVLLYKGGVMMAENIAHKLTKENPDQETKKFPQKRKLFMDLATLVMASCLT
jgi:hypothetical protein